jgi:hypothetical protein
MPQNIPVVENILNANDRIAQENYNRLENAGVFSINILASPGAGKTSLIEQTLPRLKNQLRDRWGHRHFDRFRPGCGCRRPGGDSDQHRRRLPSGRRDAARRTRKTHAHTI